MPEVADRAVRAVAQRAATLAERLGQASARLTHDDPALVQQRLEQWCQVVAKGDWETFRKRLAWDGLDLEAARRALGPLRWPDEVPLPAWAAVLQAALGRATDSEDGAADGLAAGDRFLDAAEPLPFEELLAPFVRLARRRLAASAGAAYDRLAAAAHATLERALLTVLTGYAARALYLEFSSSARSSSPACSRCSRARRTAMSAPCTGSSSGRCSKAGSSPSSRSTRCWPG